MVLIRVSFGFGFRVRVGGRFDVAYKVRVGVGGRGKEGQVGKDTL